jgi:hypothetical protein
MKIQRAINALPAFSILVLLVVLFQNCGPAKISAELQGTAVLNSTVNPNLTPPLPTPIPTPFSYDGLIVAESSDLCMDVDGGFLADGTSIGTWGCEAANVARQTFSMRPSGSGYSLRASHSGSCLSVQGGGLASGTLMVQNTCGSFPGQIWNYQDLGGSRFKLVDRNSGRCLTATDQLFNGGLNQMYIATCNAGNTFQNFHWR